MRADLGLMFSFLTIVVSIGLIVRFHQGSVGVTKAFLGGVSQNLQVLENPGYLEQKVF